MFGIIAKKSIANFAKSIVKWHNFNKNIDFNLFFSTYGTDHCAQVASVLIFPLIKNIFFSYF